VRKRARKADALGVGVQVGDVSQCDGVARLQRRAAVLVIASSSISTFTNVSGTSTDVNMFR